MKKITLLFVLFVAITATLSARVIKVDINGSGQFTSINTAIINSVTSDTIKVLPGSYFEQVTLNKNVVVMGSGYETTVITGNFNPTVIQTTGKMLWFLISSTQGTGIKISSGTLSNCCVIGCTGSGITNETSGATCTIINCIIYNNGGYGIFATDGTTINVINCISRNNTSYGFRGASGYYEGYGTCNVSYSNGSRQNTSGNQGCIDQDPNFTLPPSDFHISEGSPCWDKGNPSLLDPDGSQSDMGYFGGSDCPIYPVVMSIKIIPQPDGSIQIHAIGVANY